MDALTAIKTRRSIRHFAGREVPRELLEKIAEAGIHAPSSKNSQPWHFIIDATRKKDIIADILEKKATPEFTTMDPRTKKPATVTTAVESAQIIRDAPVAILVFSRSPFTGGRKNILGNNEEKYLLTFLSEVASVSAATQNMLLAAHSLSLGGVWNCDAYFISREIEELYSQDFEFMFLLCIGYPDENVKYREIERQKRYEFQ